MRIVSKINIALAGVVAVSALLNFAALHWTVMPSFAGLEEQAARQNQSRVLEAIQQQKDQLASSAGDYSIWDDTYEFMLGNRGDYEEKNVSSESLKTLGVNYFVAIDRGGNVILNRGFDYSADEPAAIQLLDGATIAATHPFRQQGSEIETKSGLMRTNLGLVAVGYAPILKSDRSGERLGTLVLGKLLDIQELKSVTKVDFDVVSPMDAVTFPAEGGTLDKKTELADLGGADVASIVSHTSRNITEAGTRTIWATMLFLLLAAALLIGALAFILRQIALKRVEQMRQHLTSIASSGHLEMLPDDGRNDELSEMIASFNLMAQQLAELRDKVRRQDYQHGAADQAAGILHNVRNAMSPLSTLIWKVSKDMDETVLQNLKKATDQLKEHDLPIERITKLNAFLAMSAERLISAAIDQRADLRSMVSVTKHIENILQEQADAVSQSERVTETIGVKSALKEAAQLIASRSGIEVAFDIADDFEICGHRVSFEQVLANLLINAAEAIETTKKGHGRIELSAQLTSLGARAALGIVIHDDGTGISAENLSKIFEKGFTTKEGGKGGGLGLHWCANAVNAMGGRINAESDGRGLGATLSVTLPLAKSEVKEAA